jgi:hypothetical protein
LVLRDFQNHESKGKGAEIKIKQKLHKKHELRLPRMPLIEIKFWNKGMHLDFG